MIQNSIFTETKFLDEELEEKFKSEYAKKYQNMILNITDAIILIFNIFYFLNMHMKRNYFEENTKDNAHIIVIISVFFAFLFVLVIINRILLKKYFNVEKGSKRFFMIKKIREFTYYLRLIILQLYCVLITVYFLSMNSKNYFESMFEMRLFHLNAFVANLISIINFHANLWLTILFYALSVTPVVIWCSFYENISYIWPEFLIIIVFFSFSFYLRKQFAILIRENYKIIYTNDILTDKIRNFISYNENLVEKSFDKFIVKKWNNLKHGVLIDLHKKQINFINEQLIETINKTFYFNYDELQTHFENKTNNFSLNNCENKNYHKENSEILINVLFDNLKLIQKDKDYKNIIKSEEQNLHKEQIYLSKNDSFAKILMNESFNFLKKINFKFKNEQRKVSNSKNIIYSASDNEGNLISIQDKNTKKGLIYKNVEKNKNQLFSIGETEKVNTFETNEVNMKKTNNNLNEKSNLVLRNTKSSGTFKKNTPTVLHVDKSNVIMDNVYAFEENKNRTSVRENDKNNSNNNSNNNQNKVKGNKFSNQNLRYKNEKNDSRNINFTNSEINNPLINHLNLIKQSEKAPDEDIFNNFNNKYIKNSVITVENNINDSNNPDNQTEYKIGIFVFNPSEAIYELKKLASENYANHNNIFLKQSKKNPPEIPQGKLYFEISIISNHTIPEIKNNSNINETENLDVNKVSENAFVLTDVTRFYKSYEKILSKNEFSHTKMSKLIHEFKTPLNCIIGLSSDINDLIGNKKINYEEVNDNIEKIFNLSNYTIFLIRDLMRFFSKEIKQSSNKNRINNNKNLNATNANKLPSNKSNNDNLNYPNPNLNANNNNINNVNNPKNAFSPLITNKDVKNSIIGTQIEFAISTHQLSEILNFSFSILTVLIKCSKIKKENIQPILKIEKELENMLILTNEIKIKQILLNLISNSVKFTNSGVIVLHANFKNEAKDLVEISIIDSGIGISKSEHQKFSKIFQK